MLVNTSIGEDRTVEDVAVVTAGVVSIETGAHLTLRRVTMIAASGTRFVVHGGLTLEDVDASTLSIDVRGSAVITRVSFEATVEDAIVVTGGTLTTTDVTITAPRGVGIRAVDATVDARDLSIAGAGGYALALTRSTATLDELSVTSPGDYGLHASASRVDIRNATFDGHCGVYLTDATTGAVADTTFATLDHGLVLFRAGAVALDRLRFEGGSVGLLSYSSHLDARDIDAIGTAQGILALSSTGSVTGGRFSGATAVEIDGDGSRMPVLRNLDLAAAAVGLRNRTATAADARWNWWGGTPGTSGTAALIGPAAVDPWLTAAP